jgi:predicted acylesterase/phospholipase RssA
MKALIALLGFALCLGAADLEAVKKEPDLERRSEKALDAALEAVKRARTLPAEGGSLADLQKDMDAVIDAVELALQSLRDTGKKPNKLTRSYKRGELKTREIQKHIDILIQALAFDNRPPAEKAQARMNVLHDEFLFGVMSGK